MKGGKGSNVSGFIKDIDYNGKEKERKRQKKKIQGKIVHSKVVLRVKMS